MAYDPNVPNAANQVRGSGGDLDKMQQNFEALDPLVASGLNAVISGGTAASGSIAVAQGSGNAQWNYSTLSALAAAVLELANLSDVSTTTPNDGEVLKFNSGTWGPAADAGGAGGGGGATLASQGILRMVSGGSLTIPSGVWTTILSGATASGSFASGGWTSSETSGLLIIPPVSSGLDHVRVHAQVGWDNSDDGTGFRAVRLRISGSEGGPQSPTYVTPHSLVRAVSGTAFTQGFVSPLLVISGGEHLSLEVYHENSADPDVVGGGFVDATNQPNGRLTYMVGQGYTTSGGAGGAGLHYQCRLTLASAQVRTVTSGVATNDILSGGQEVVNVGGWTTNVAQSGSITVPAGLTHVSYNAQVAWGGTGSGTGYRDVVVRKVGAGDAGANVDESDGFNPLQPRDRRLGQDNAIQSFSSPLIPVTGGEVFQLGVVHTDSHGSETVVGGGAAEGGLTFLDMRGYSLTAGS